MTLKELLVGFGTQVRSIWMIGLHAFAKRETRMYPEEPVYLPPRYRGRIVLISALLVTLFFGGWHGPFGILPQIPFIWFALKTAFFIMIFILLRASIPRPRYDQVMDFSWKFCLPLTLVNMLVTAAIVLLNTPAVAAQ